MTAPALVVRVFGDPAPQGSKRVGRNRATGRAVLIESSKKVKPWRGAVDGAVREAVELVEWEAIDGPASVHLAFYLERPPSVPRRRRRPSVKPDLDKLTRSTLDALTSGGAFVDDGRVVELFAAKHYADPVNPAGVVIRVERTEP